MRGRKRSRPESPVAKTRLMQVSAADDYVEAPSYGLSLDEPRYLLFQRAGGSGLSSAETAYCSNLDTPDADLPYQRKCSTTGSPCTNYRSTTSVDEKNMAEHLWQSSWTYAVYGLVSVLAGHMWQFCKKNAFRGFHAGGGIGFGWKGEKGTVSVDEDEDEVIVSRTGESSNMDLARVDHHRMALRNYPSTDVIDTHKSDGTATSSCMRTAPSRAIDGTCRASKRQQVAYDGAWVVVSYYNGYDDRHQTRSKSRSDNAFRQVRKSRKAHVAVGGHLRSCSCCGSPYRPRPHSRSRSRAMAQTSNGYLLPNSSQNCQHAGHVNSSAQFGSLSESENSSQELSMQQSKQDQARKQHQSSFINFEPSSATSRPTAEATSCTPVKSLRHAASMDFDTIARSRVRSRLSTASAAGSPLSADTRRYQMRQRREERRTEASIQKANDRLKDMIREAREALKSDYHMEDVCDGEVW